MVALPWVDAFVAWVRLVLRPVAVLRVIVILALSSAPLSAGVMTWYGPTNGPVAGWNTGTDSITWTAISSLNGAVNTGIAGQLDFVGNTNNPGAYFANYGGFLFFRMRVNIGTVTNTTFHDTHLVLFDVLGWNYPTNGATGYPDFAISWDSKSVDTNRHGMEMQIPPSTKQGTNWGGIQMDDIDGSAGDKIAPPDINTNGQGYIRTIDGQAAISTNNTTFIDFAIARSYLNPIPVPSGANTNLVNILNHDFRLQFGSIANATDHNPINADVAGPYTLSSTVTNSWSDPLSAHLDILWTGAQSNSTWDISSTNWRDAPNGLNPSAPDLAFISGDDVWFGNQAASNSPITVSTNIIAGTMTVTNTTGTVIFRSNSITASSLTKTEAGGLTISNSLALYGTTNNTNGVFLNTGSGNISVEGTFSQGSLKQSGTGTITLYGANTYSGGTTIDSGVVRAQSNSSALGTGAVVLNGGTLELATAGSSLNFGRDVTVSNSSTITIDRTTAGAANNVSLGTLTMAGGKTLTLARGTNITSLNPTLFMGAVTLSGSGATFAVGVSNNLYLTNGITGNNTSFSVTNDGSSIVLISNTIATGTGGLTKNGGGQLWLMGSNSFSGGVTVNSGTLVIGNSNALGTGTLTIGSTGGTTTLEATTTAISNAQNNPMAWNGSFSFGNNAGYTNYDMGTGAVTLGTNVTVSVKNYSLTVGGAISGNYSLTKAQTNTLILTGVNTYTGGTVISNAGTLALAGSGSLPTNGALVITSSANFDISAITGGSTTVGSLAGNGTVNLGTKTLVMGNTNNTSFSGSITNSGSITKQGTGTMTLTGGNTYSGTTTVSKGSLVLSNTGGVAITASSSISVGSGASLVLGTSNQIGDSTGLILNGGTFLTGSSTTGYTEDLGTLTLSANSSIDLGSNTTTRNLLFDASNGITWTSGQKLIITNWQGTTNGGTYGRIYFGSDSSGLTSSQLSQINFNIGGTLYGARILSTGEIVMGDPAPIPEPRVYLGAAVLVLFVIWRERRRLATLFRCPAWMHFAVATSRLGSHREVPRQRKIPGQSH